MKYSVSEFRPRAVVIALHFTYVCVSVHVCGSNPFRHILSKRPEVLFLSQTLHPYSNEMSTSLGHLLRCVQGRAARRGFQPSSLSEGFYGFWPYQCNTISPDTENFSSAKLRSTCYVTSSMTREISDMIKGEILGENLLPFSLLLRVLVRLCVRKQKGKLTCHLPLTHKYCKATRWNASNMGNFDVLMAPFAHKNKQGMALSDFITSINLAHSVGTQFVIR